MTFELVPLGELGTIVSGSTPNTSNSDYWGGDISWITPANLTKHRGIHFTGELRKITEAGYKSCSTKMIPAGSIVFSTRAPIGHCAVTTFPLCTNQGFKSIIPNERLDPVYGFFALTFFKSKLKSLGRGATFKEVNKEIFENFCIPLPPLAEQKRIAAQLAKADRLRQLRRYASQLGESYLQSAFLEMFGDPIRNAKGWEKVKISELGKVQTGNTPSRKQLEYYGDYIEWIKSDNILDNKLYVTKSREKLSKVGLEKGRCVEKPSVLITCIAGSLSHVGDVALTDRKVTFNQQINAITPYPDVNLFFLYTLLIMTKSYIQYNATAGMKHIITKSKLEKLTLIKPPLAEQERFAAIVARYERLRSQAREAERQVEGLFQSLLALSFTEGLSESFGE